MDLPDASNGIDVSSAYDDLEARFQRFESVILPMFITGGFRVNNKGDVVVTFTIPFKYADMAYGTLVNAMGIPLQVQLKRWTGE